MNSCLCFRTKVVKKEVKIQQPSWIFPTTFLLLKHAWPAVGCNIHSDTRALTINSESCWMSESRGVPKQNRGQRPQTTNIFSMWISYIAKKTITYPTFIHSLSWSMTHSSVHGIPRRFFSMLSVQRNSSNSSSHLHLPGVFQLRWFKNRVNLEIWKKTSQIYSSSHSREVEHDLCGDSDMLWETQGCM